MKIVSISTFISGGTTFEINIREPIALIKEKLTAAIEDFDFVNSLKLIMDVLFKCILPGLTSSPGSRSLDLNNSTEFQKLAKLIEFHTPQLPLLAKIELINYCNTPAFEIIHNYLIADEQWADLIKFFYDSGYPEVYTAFIDLYTASNCKPELIADLPTGPPAPEKVRSSKPINIREEILAIKPNQEGPLPPPTCNWLDILAQIPGSGLLSIVDFIDTTLKEFQTNPSLHFLVGKIQEPVKGVSFRGFRQLPPIKGVITQLHEGMIENNIWRIIFNFIKQIGIDFYKANLADTLVSIVEYIVWGTPFPVPDPIA
ncbi:unnamed protein product [Orchesella dallaii]|uniref:Uncharacterized protein n=1 Tax=Orchesella dallaii TaxID=48710 RepID=A0ABP1QLF4_9HEXA